MTALVAAGFVAQPAAAAPVESIGFGFPHGDVAAVNADGGFDLAYCSDWVVGSVDEGSVRSALRDCKAAGAIPVVHWYYWGDTISDTCVDYQTKAESTAECKYKNQQDWFNGAKALADIIQSEMAGAEVWVTVELEFNKGGTSQDSTFPGELKDQSDVFQARGIKTVAPPRNWASNLAHFQVFFDDADAAGSQILKSCVHSTQSSLRDSNVKLYDHLSELKTLTNDKPLMVYDWGVASYSGSQCEEDGPNYETVQRDVVDDFFTNWIDDYRGLGVFAYIYRLRQDPGGSSGHHKDAEKYFGFIRESGVEKPAYPIVLDGIRTEAGRGGGTPGPNEWRKEAELFATKTTGGQFADANAAGGAYWNLWADGSISDSMRIESGGPNLLRVSARGDPAGGVWPEMKVYVDTTLVLQTFVTTKTWRTYSTVVDRPQGDYTLRIEFTNDAVTATEDRNLKVDFAMVSPGSAERWGQEVESFDTKTTGADFADSTASGERYWNLWADGHVATSFTTGLSGTHELRVVARGDAALGVWPHMKVYVDDVLAFETDVTTTTWQTYSGEADFGAGTHTLKIEFTNDYSDGSEDRNLKLDRASAWM